MTTRVFNPCDTNNAPAPKASVDVADQLTDAQLDAITAGGGGVGVNPSRAGSRLAGERA